MTAKSILILVLGLAFMYGLFTVGSPFLLALIVAIFLEPLVISMMRVKRMNRFMASLIVCTLFTLVTALIFYGLGFKVITETIEFTKKISVNWNSPDHMLNDFIVRIQEMFDALSPELAMHIKTGLNNILSSLAGLIQSISGYFFTFAKYIPNMLIWFIVFLIAVYLIWIESLQIKVSFLSLFEQSSRGKMEAVLNNLRQAILGFIMAQLILSMVTSQLTLAGLLLLKTTYPLALSFLIVVVDILPILGTGSVLLPWAIYEFITGDTFMGTGLLILFGVITVVRRIIEPKVLGSAIGISALASLISLYIGFKLIGIVGLFLGQ